VLRKQPSADPGRSSVLHFGLSEDQPTPSGPGKNVWIAAKQSQPMDSYPFAGLATCLAYPRRCTNETISGLGPLFSAIRGALALFCHDGTERRIPRPQDTGEQKRLSSGKKKCHTRKNLLVIDQTLQIVYLSPTSPGAVHDKRIADEYPYPLPDGSLLWQDLGFLAYELDGVTMHTPHKKPKGGTLTPEQKTENRALSSVRVRIEHVNSRVKRCRTLQDPLRLRRSNMFDLVMEIGCGLHNFRIRLSPWSSLI
jgi:DDE superfamily endonuclease